MWVFCVSLSQVCPVEGCPAPPPPPIIEREPFVRDWSNATQWPGGVVPAAGDDVLVERAWQLRLDMEPEVIRHLVVEGELFFDERRASTTLQVRSVGLFCTVLTPTPEESQKTGARRVRLCDCPPRRSFVRPVVFRFFGSHCAGLGMRVAWVGLGKTSPNPNIQAEIASR